MVSNKRTEVQLSYARTIPVDTLTWMSKNLHIQVSQDSLCFGDFDESKNDTFLTVRLKKKGIKTFLTCPTAALLLGGSGDARHRNPP